MKRLLIQSILWSVFCLQVKAQSPDVPGQVTRLFTCIQHKDLEGYRKLWPEVALQAMCSVKAEHSGYPPEALPLFRESMDHVFQANILHAYLFTLYGGEEQSAAWEHFSIRDIYVDSSRMEEAYPVRQVTGYVWLKDTVNGTDWACSFGDVLEIQRRFYGGRFAEVIPLRDLSFEAFIREQEPVEAYAEPVTDAATAVEAYADTAAMVAADHAAMLLQIDYEGMLNGDKLTFHCWTSSFYGDTDYHNCSYQYVRQEDDTYFEQAIALGNRYYLFIEAGGKGYFHLQQTDGKLSGTWFAADSGKTYPVALDRIRE